MISVHEEINLDKSMRNKKENQEADTAVEQGDDNEHFKLMQHVYSNKQLPSNLPKIKRKVAVKEVVATPTASKLAKMRSSLNHSGSEAGVQSLRKSADHLVTALKSKDYISVIQDKIKWNNKMHMNFLSKIESEQGSSAGLALQSKDVVAVAKRSRNYLEDLI